MLNCGTECLLPRPLSIHQVNDKSIALFYAVLAEGKGTKWLSQRKKGDTVKLSVSYPLGNGFCIRRQANKLLLVAGGNGIASLRFLADEAIKQGLKTTLLYGTANDLRYPENLLSPEIKLFVATEDGSAGKRGKVTDLLTPEIIDWAGQIFACGPTAMYYNMARRKEELGLTGKPVQISLEMRMGCGRGICYTCTVRTKSGLKQVCKDGPVFDLDEIIWDELVLEGI
jgi:dihydroorotate dehydrogenase electron transfer subunit